MANNRRQFLASTAAIGGLSALFPLTSCNPDSVSGMIPPDYSALDAALAKPVFRKELFPDPVIIESLELLRDRNSTICRVRSKDGVEGISIGHPFIAKNSYPMFTNLLFLRVDIFFSSPGEHLMPVLLVQKPSSKKFPGNGCA